MLIERIPRVSCMDPEAVRENRQAEETFLYVQQYEEEAGQQYSSNDWNTLVQFGFFPRGINSKISKCGPPEESSQRAARARGFFLQLFRDTIPRFSSVPGAPELLDRFDITLSADIGDEALARQIVELVSLVKRLFSGLLRRERNLFSNISPIVILTCPKTLFVELLKCVYVSSSEILLELPKTEASLEERCQVVAGKLRDRTGLQVELCEFGPLERRVKLIPAEIAKRLTTLHLTNCSLETLPPMRQLEHVHLSSCCTPSCYQFFPLAPQI